MLSKPRPLIPSAHVVVFDGSDRISSDVAAALGHDPAVLLNTYAVAVVAGQRAASDVLGRA